MLMMKVIDMASYIVRDACFANSNENLHYLMERSTVSKNNGTLSNYRFDIDNNNEHGVVRRQMYKYQYHICDYYNNL